MAGIYIHVPFCKQACHYCDFHFSTNLGRTQQMAEMICKELMMRANYLEGEKIETVYFGGGTPSLFNGSQLEAILNQIKSTFTCDWQEVTLEANPDDLSKENLSNWKKLGIDRLSLGIQSFDEEVLKFYNRAHTALESQVAIEEARKSGFEKFSMDLIYGFPKEDHSLWTADLKMAIAQNPGHISSYSLTIEPNTALSNWTQKGKFKPADDDFVAEQFEILQKLTEQAGYVQYEVSNFGKPGQFALHNTNYWKGVPFLGIGPSAHSFDGEARGANVSNNSRYLAQLEKGSIAFTEEPLSSEEQLNEYILTGLRTVWGIDFKYILEKYNRDLISDKRKLLEQLDQEGRLIWEDKKLSLSKTGKLLADSIAAALFV